ncbi:ABC transporter permease, partial [Escherichia coli]|uniref:ABC transporter permease n=1 Tax=Escherichia coli TaxID=562 RepID=UPI0013665FBF|nr:ABC transporter permease [Escherichia coli]
VGIWVFFWAVSVPFGTASGAQNILDQASTLGIMAVAVSMLMIGGEFDLSSGANTGAMGILTIFLVKETGALGGAGLPIWLALLISFAVAMAIGWFNGFMVDRNQLPSFIVTLATFFVLIGLKLGLSKRLVDKIEMGRMD